MRLRSRLLPLAFLVAVTLFAGRGISLAQGSATTHPAATAAPSGDPLDINTVSRDQLKGLPGIGDAYADRIIKGRPYTAKNQLTLRGIIPDATYAKIKDQIIAKRAAK